MCSEGASQVACVCFVCDFTFGASDDTCQQQSVEQCTLPLDKLYTSIYVHHLQKFAEIEKLRMHTNSFAYRSVCICGYQETRYMGKYVRKGWIMDIPHKLYM